MDKDRDFEEGVLMRNYTCCKDSDTQPCPYKDLVCKDNKEGDGEAPEEEPDLGIVETYKIIWKIICNPLVTPLIIFLFTAGIGFTASESISSLRLISAGSDFKDYMH